jgi:hypothetical protein
MGIIQEATRAPERGPECPAQLAHVVDKYRSLKFVQRRTDEAVVLYPRDQLSWQDLAAYKGVTGDSISLLEAELIMGLDGIFEGRDDG